VARIRGDLVRLFPDYAESVVWFPSPVDYAGTGLDEDLLTDLRRWEASYYDSLDDYEWRSGDLKRAFEAEGGRLGHRLSEALGPEFVVEVGGRRLRSRRPAKSPRAADAFRAIAAAEREKRERIARAVADGAELSWNSDPPDQDP
jgi:hypothetical protein